MSVYCRTPVPSVSRGMKVLLQFGVRAYVPMIAEVFLMPEFWNGTMHWFNHMKRAKNCLNRQHFNFVKKYFLINGGWFHPENVLMCTILSPQVTQAIKREALKILLEVAYS